MSNMKDSDVSSVIEEQVFKEQDLLLRRLTQYATVRPGDLQAILQGERNEVFRRNFENHYNVKPTRCPEADDGWKSIFEPKPIVEECPTMVVNGKENNDAPAEYVIKGLKIHELPVIGLYVHGQISPGFPYRVRYLGKQQYVFDGKARCLESIGMGYGKRLTFTGDTKNHNDCYFWSDSHPDGFGFSLVAVERHQKFVILNSQMEPVGEAVVESVQDDQREVSTDILNGTVTKNVRVTAECSITYYQRSHGLLELHQTHIEAIDGLAVLIKQKREKRASLKRIENVFLSRFGECSLHEDI